MPQVIRAVAKAARATQMACIVDDDGGVSLSKETGLQKKKKANDDDDWEPDMGDKAVKLRRGVRMRTNNVVREQTVRLRMGDNEGRNRGVFMCLAMTTRAATIT
jgi:hypothetical protein